MAPREKLAEDLELLKPVVDHVAYWSCGLIAGQSLTLGDLRALLAEPEQQSAELTRTREALAVAKGAIRKCRHDCGCMMTCEHCERATAALARIAALSPTGTPGAEGEPTI